MERLRRVIAISVLAASLGLPAGSLSAGSEENHWTPGAVYILEGHRNLFVYSIGEHKLLKQGSPVCEAVLIITGKDTFIMNVVLTLANGTQREEVKYGTITPSGRVTFDYLGEEEALQMNVGVTAHGRGIVDGITIHKGWFDEVSLFASFEVIGHQTTWPNLKPYQKDPTDPTLLYEGPISVYEDFDLMVVESFIP